MSDFDFQAGKRFREEGDLAEAIRCLKSAVEQNGGFIEAFVELGRTYIMAFHESGDPLCLDSARKVCLAALRRDCDEEQRALLTAMQDRVEELLLESQKAEMDAMTDAMDQMESGPGLLPDDESMPRPLDEITEFRGTGRGDPEDDLGH